MKCPDDIAPTIIEILRTAILRIRDAGGRGDAELCAIEADHVHNLPGLLENFSLDLLGYYWKVERDSFLRALNTHALRKGTTADSRWFDNAWALLARHLNLSERKTDANSEAGVRTQLASR